MAAHKNLTMVVLYKQPQEFEHLKHLMKLWENVSIVGATHDLSTAMEMFRKLEPDIFFLDDKALNGDTTSVVNELNKQNFHTHIFLHSESRKDHLLRLKSAVPVYLIEPVNRNSFVEAIELIQVEIKLRTLQNQLDALPDNWQTEKVMLTTKLGFQFVRPRQIVFCKADSNYTRIALLSKKQILVTKTLSRFYEETLPYPEFVRISRSVVINKSYLTEVVKSDRKCILQTSDETYCFTTSPEYYKILKNNHFSRFTSLNEKTTSHNNMLPLLNKYN